MIRSLLLLICLCSLPIIACGGSSSLVLPAGTLQPENASIAGLPQYIPPSSTPPPTDTQVATAVLPTSYIPASGYVTYTPYPGSVYVCQGGICFYATNTPYPGGFYSTPARTIVPPSLTPRPTYTPYPSATPCSSMVYYFDDEVFTDNAAENVTLGIAVGNIRTYPSSIDSDRQVTVYMVELRNLGPLTYVLLAPFQIYVAQVDGQRGGWYASEAAATDIGQTPSQAMLEAVIIEQGERITFDLHAYTPIGEVDAIAYILDPYANGYDGTIAGGNVAYWQAGSRTSCGLPGGRIAGTFTPPPNSTPQPTVTATATVDSCAVTNSCITVVPGG